MAFTSSGTIGATAEKVLDNSLVHTVATTSPAAGALVIIVIAKDNAATADGNTSEISSVVDSASNTWTKLREFCNSEAAADEGVTVSVWHSVLTTGLTAGSSTITITLSDSRTSKVVTGWAWTIAEASVQVAANATDAADDGIDASAMTIASLASKEYLFLRGIGMEHEDTTFTPTTSYTGFTAITTGPAGLPATNIVGAGEFRILTGTGDTSDPDTVDAGAKANVFLAIEEVAAAAGLSFEVGQIPI